MARNLSSRIRHDVHGVTARKIDSLVKCLQDSCPDELLSIKIKTILRDIPADVFIEALTKRKVDNKHLKRVESQIWQKVEHHYQTSL